MPRLTTVVLLLALGPIARGQIDWPALPGGLGVNIHFTDPKPGEMNLLADAGFALVRMDLTWSRIESKKGQYDFSAYDRLMQECDAHSLRVLFILDYANPLYDDGLSPHTDEGRAAFARWAAESVKHFKGRRIIWEIYNEPNIAAFWKPEPNADDYVKLALAATRAIHEVSQLEAVIGPACSKIDLPFLETCFKAGLLDEWSAVSVHPYRQQDPETVADEYRQLRMLIRKYAPKYKAVPIFSGEWGYSSVWSGMDDERQAKLLPRQWLTNIMNDVPVSVWYDWRDDGNDPKDPEHHFGTVKSDATPKPAYLAAKTFTTQLNGFTFNKRIVGEDPADYLLLFRTTSWLPIIKSDEFIYVAWTTRAQPVRATLPASLGKFTILSYTSERQNVQVQDHAPGLVVDLTDAPQYIIPQQDDPLITAIADWKRVPLDIVVTRDEVAAGHLPGFDPFNRPMTAKERAAITRARQRQRQEQQGGAAIPPAPEFAAIVPFQQGYRITMQPEPQRIEFHREVQGGNADGMHVAQESHVSVSDPLDIRLAPRIGRILPVIVENPGGTPFSGRLAICGASGQGTVENVEMKAGQTSLTCLRNVPPGSDDAQFVAAARLVSDAGITMLDISPHRFRALALRQEDLGITAGGDANTKSDQSFRLVAAPAGLPADGADAIRFDYRFDAGWKFAQLQPTAAPLQSIGGEPTHLGMWIKGDGSENIARIRFVDSTGQTFQPEGERLNFKEWHYVEFPLQTGRAGHWGGANDGSVHYPIKLDTLLLIDSARREQTKGTVHLSSPTLIYPVNPPAEAAR